MGRWAFVQSVAGFVKVDASAGAADCLEAWLRSCLSGLEPWIERQFIGDDRSSRSGRAETARESFLLLQQTKVRCLQSIPAGHVPRVCSPRLRRLETRASSECQFRSAIAFSLLELVVVVVIIGVIASIAVPRIAAAASNSAEVALKASLSSMRQAIDYYAAEHRGVFPGSVADGTGGGANSALAFVNQMTKYSSADGKVTDSWDTDHLYGQYLRVIAPVPVGPNKGNTTVAIDTANTPPLVTGGTEGWVYNPTTGDIIANTDDANRAGTRAYDEY